MAAEVLWFVPVAKVLVIFSVAEALEATIAIFLEATIAELLKEILLSLPSRTSGSDVFGFLYCLRVTSGSGIYSVAEVLEATIAELLKEILLSLPSRTTGSGISVAAEVLWFVPVAKVLVIFSVAEALEATIAISLEVTVVELLKKSFYHCLREPQATAFPWRLRPS